MPVAAIAGLGLIGGSIGIACRRDGWEVWFHDPAVRIDEAARAGAAERQVPLDDFARADLAVIATPIDVAVQLLPQLSACRTVMSVCSLMQPVVQARTSDRVIATHPMAGSERSSLPAATNDLFRGRTWFVEQGRAGEEVAALIASCGADLVEVTAEEHDRAITLTSQLPQLLSTSLAALLERSGVDERFIGTGFRTFARLAGSSSAVWQPLFEANQEELRVRVNELFEVVKSVGAGDAQTFESANRLWELINRRTADDRDS